MKMFLVVIVGALLAALAVVLVLAGGFSREIGRAEARLSGYPPGTVRRNLPAQVQAFAERGMGGGVPGVAVVLEQAAEMRLKRGAAWTGLSARQTIAVPRPGFAWVAAMKVGPVPAVRVIDRYVEGDGLLEVRALGAIRMGRETGADAALSEGLRYLAELPWSPDAILTNPYVAWRETAGGAVARMETAGGPAEVQFSFDAAGDIVGITAKGRPAKLDDGSMGKLDWQGQFSRYEMIGGRRIPVSGEIGYLYADGYEAYWRGRITGYRVVAGGGG